ncbi:MAG: hypothetical protein IK134_10470 [Oscillospiraceae bacterium]|nr:hypothetical protein [Oscillospiraceae bacterium]MBP0988375.1 hypothetical protein [Oscillospiraceae bacterium]MBQ5339638.1 hypothetical protein [Oscillospiraceae bacterium]MBQ9906723.1 hypothetical protein [Oscillospiraceae bacterium]MBR5363731.1 hypothetical protein [Oscillospiraceae bacterium]
MKKHLWTYFLNVMFSFGLTTAFLTVIIILVGDTIKGETGMTLLGSEGIPTAFLLQFLIADMIVMALRKLFLSDLCIRNMKPSPRVILFLVSSLLTMTCFILVCGWFPTCGLLVFIPCSVCAIILNAMRLFRSEAANNKALADALTKYKSDHAS